MTVSHMSTSKLTAASLHRRHAVEKRFRAYGVVAIVTALVFLILCMIVFVFALLVWGCLTVPGLRVCVCLGFWVCRFSIQ